MLRGESLALGIGARRLWAGTPKMGGGQCPFLFNPDLSTFWLRWICYCLVAEMSILQNTINSDPQGRSRQHDWYGLGNFQQQGVGFLAKENKLAEHYKSGLGPSPVIHPRELPWERRATFWGVFGSLEYTPQATKARFAQQRAKTRPSSERHARPCLFPSLPSPPLPHPPGQDLPMLPRAGAGCHLTIPGRIPCKHSAFAAHRNSVAWK